jgi:glucose/arabinose dehydrogenase
MDNAQSLNSLLGKVLRLDVSGATGYQIPAGNPFTQVDRARGEIWAFGLRNPWRFSFDRPTGDLYLADVGQNSFEEVDYQSGGSGGGENYGWPIVEGAGHCFRPTSGCNQAGLTAPLLDYPNPQEGCSVTGGYVYRGCTLTSLHGTYFYSDYCSGFVRSLRVQQGQAVEQRDRTAELGGALASVSSFGEDARGELYLLSHEGTVYRLEPR